MKPEHAIQTDELQILSLQQLPTGEKIIPSMKISEFLKLKSEGWTSDYKSINKLLIHLSRRSKSEATRKNYLQTIKSFCVYIGTTPDEVIKMPKNKVESLVQKFGDTYNTSNYSKRTANNVLASLKSFFEANGFKGTKLLQLEGYYMPTRYRKIDEYIPRKYEVYQMADSAGSLRNRAIILTLNSSGLRTSTLIALCYKDIKDELIRGISNPRLPVYTEMKQIIPDACKNSLPYYTFVCDEATEAIRLYLQERTDKYGAIDDNDPLFASDYNQIEKEARSKKFLTQRQVQKIVKTSAKLAGIKRWEDVTPKCLRKSYETVIHSETYDGGRLDPKIQEFLMGHTLPGCQDNYFDSTKIEEIRMEYSKLKFNRVVVENKFKKLRNIVAQAFEGTGEDPDKLMEEYIKRRKLLKKALKEKP